MKPKAFKSVKDSILSSTYEYHYKLSKSKVLDYDYCSDSSNWNLTSSVNFEYPEFQGETKYIAHLEEKFMMSSN